MAGASRLMKSASPDVVTLVDSAGSVAEGVAAGCGEEKAVGVQEENSAKLFDIRSEGKEGWVRARMKSDWVESGFSEAEKWGMGKEDVNWPLIL